jgi:hypothetical protein
MMLAEVTVVVMAAEAISVMVVAASAADVTVEQVVTVLTVVTEVKEPDTVALRFAAVEFMTCCTGL